MGPSPMDAGRFLAEVAAPQSGQPRSSRTLARRAPDRSESMGAQPANAREGRPRLRRSGRSFPRAALNSFSGGTDVPSVLSIRSHPRQRPRSRRKTPIRIEPVAAPARSINAGVSPRRCYSPIHDSDHGRFVGVLGGGRQAYQAEMAMVCLPKASEEGARHTRVPGRKRNRSRALGPPEFESCGSASPVGRGSSAGTSTSS